MTKKKILLWCTVFLCMLIAPTCMWFAIGGTDEENHENRTETTLSAPTLSTITVYPEELESYYNDHLPFRSKLISMNSLLSYRLLGESVTDKVIVGKDGWLFYNRADDGNPMLGYKGLNIYSQEHLSAISSQLEATRTYLEEHDCEFVLMIVPDKERMYSEYMSDDYGAPSYYGKADLLVDYLRNYTFVRVVYAKEALTAYKLTNPDEPLYYHYDTHWNQLGAYVGTSALLSELGVEAVPVDSLGKEQIANSEYDLADLMNLRDYLTDDVDYQLTGYGEENVTAVKDDDDEISRFQSSGRDTRKVMLVRDSFGNEMKPYLAAYFDETVVMRRNSTFNDYTQEIYFEDEKPDVLVFEITERYMDDLVTFMMPRYQGG